MPVSVRRTAGVPHPASRAPGLISGGLVRADRNRWQRRFRRRRGRRAGRSEHQRARGGLASGRSGRGAGQAVDMTARITRRQVVHGLINEYRRAA
jgi:hypothetical protein